MSKVTKVSKSDKELKPEFTSDETEAFIEPAFKKAESPEPTLRDIILKIDTIKNELIGSANSLEAKMFEIGEQMNQLNMAFVGVSAELVELRNLKAGIPERDTQPKPQIEKVQQVGLIEYDSLPWKPTKYGHYIFANTIGAEKLVKAIADSNNKLRVGGYTYKQSGEGGKFVNRSQNK